MCRTMKSIFQILILFLSIFSLEIIAAQEGRYALVIGNSNYTDLGKLKNPVNDATDIATALKGLGFEVTILLNAGIVEMDDAITKLKSNLSQKTDSVGLFFYAGHGIQSQGVNYLIPADARIPSENYLKVRAVSVQTILESLQEARNSLNMVILDACRDNPFSWVRSGTRGLSVVGGQPAGSIIMYATSAGSVAQDGVGRNGIFTTELLKNLSTADIDVVEVFRRTGKSVSLSTNGLQIPAIYSQFFDVVYLNQKHTQSIKATTTINSIPNENQVSSSIKLPRQGLIAEYLFDNDAFDTSGNGNNGIVNGAIPINNRKGQMASAFRFDKNLTITIPSSKNLNFGSDDYTVCLWINCGIATNTGSIISKWDEEHNTGWNLGYNAAENRFNVIGIGKAEGFDRMYNCPVAVIFPYVQNTVRGWEFITLVRNNSEGKIKLFINGRLSGLEDLDHYRMGRDGQIYYSNMKNYSTNTSKPIIIGYGTNLYGFDTWFRGDVDDIRIYNRALSDEEIFTLSQE